MQFLCCYFFYFSLRTHTHTHTWTNKNKAPGRGQQASKRKHFHTHSIIFCVYLLLVPHARPPNHHPQSHLGPLYNLSNSFAMWRKGRHTAIRISRGRDHVFPLPLSHSPLLSVLPPSRSNPLARSRTRAPSSKFFFFVFLLLFLVCCCCCSRSTHEFGRKKNFVFRVEGEKVALG